MDMKRMNPVGVVNDLPFLSRSGFDDWIDFALLIKLAID